MRLPQTLGLCLVLVAVSCRSLQDLAPPVQSGMAGDLRRLTEGRQIYLNSCFNCHNLQAAVRELSIEKWNAILPGMGKKAKLSSESATKLRDYIMAACQWNLQNTAEVSGVISAERE